MAAGATMMRGWGRTWRLLLRGRLAPPFLPGRWSFLAATGAALLLLLGVAVLVTAVDPHNLYPWGAHPKLGEEKLMGAAQSQVLNVVTDGDFDGLLIGASSAHQFEGPDLSRYLDGVTRGYALTYNGAAPGDLQVIMRRVAETPGLKRAVLSYDLSYMAPAGVAQPGFPMALYDDTPFNDLGALGPSSLRLSLRLLRGQSYWDQRWDMTAYRKYMAGVYERSRSPKVVKIYKGFIADQKARIDAPTTLTCADFTANDEIADFARRLNQRGVRLDIVIPPYSYVAYYDLSRPERVQRVRGQPALAALLQARRCMIAAVAPYPNTQVHGFDLDAGLTDDLANYWDATHLYGSARGIEMLKAINRGDHVLTVQNFEPYARELRRRVAAYHYYNSKVAP